MFHDLVVGVLGFVVLAVLATVAVRTLLRRRNPPPKDPEREVRDGFARVVAGWHLNASDPWAGGVPLGLERPGERGSDVPDGDQDVLPLQDDLPCPHRARAGDRSGACEACSRQT
jgi:hypothetical protein